MMDFSTEISGSRKYEISALPVEILPTVFKHLSANERKAARLVCKCWKEHCNLPSVSQDEVIKCLGFYQLADTYEFLKGIERRSLNLNFNGVDFTNDSSFWKINGPRIRSITFENCLFEENIFVDIINFCENLLHLTIRLSSYLPISLPDFAKVSERGIVRNSLQYLEIYEPERCFSEEYIFQLCSAFPRLKVLKIDILSWDYNPFHPIVNDYLMILRDRIEKLELFPMIQFSSNDFHRFLDTLTNMRRLTELSVDARELTQENFDKLEQFFYSKALKSLKYQRMRSQKPLESFLLQLLHSNSNLQHLKIFSQDDLVVTRCLFEKLMSSNLKSCLLDIRGNVSVQDLDSVVSCPLDERNTTASPSFTIHLSNIDDHQDSNVVSFLQCLPNVHRLRVYTMTPNILQTLFKYQRKLKSLITLPSAQHSRIGEYVEMSKHEFNQLTEIELLELEESVTYVFLKSLTPESVFANLKYLKIKLCTRACAEDCEWAPSSDLSKLADAAPFLEALYLAENLHLTLDYLCTEVCSKLTQLRFLCWAQREESEANNEERYTDEAYGEVFSHCSSLRGLCHSHVRGPDKFFFDTLKKKVTRIADERDYGFAESRICGLDVYWISF